MLKRSIDIGLSVPLLVLAFPVLVLAVISILVADGAPPLIGQHRVGFQRREFRMWKLRTMYRNADMILQEHLSNDGEAAIEWSQHLRLTNDPRLLGVVGRWLRKSSIDELPQFWNVLRGDMSLVGPRPLPVPHAAQLTLRAQAERCTMKPGITGLWQIAGRGETTLNSLERLDRLYLSRSSARLDLWILLKTVPTVLLGRGAY